MLSFKVGEDWGLPTKLVIGREPQGDNVLLEDKSIELEPKTKNILSVPTSGTYESNTFTTTYNGDGSLTCQGTVNTEGGRTWCNYTKYAEKKLDRGVYLFTVDKINPYLQNLRFMDKNSKLRNATITRMNSGAFYNATDIDVVRFYLYQEGLNFEYKQPKEINETYKFALYKVGFNPFGNYNDLLTSDELEVVFNGYDEPLMTPKGMTITKSETDKRIVFSGKPQGSWQLIFNRNTKEMDEVLEDGALYFYSVEGDTSLIGAGYLFIDNATC